MLAVVCIAAALLALWCLLLLPRRGQPGWEAIGRARYAHRGLHDASRPENSLSAFRAAAERGLGAELDVHLMADGALAVVHDSSELKAERGNAAALTDAVMAQLAGWQGTYCIESFHPAVLLRLRQRYPEVLRGQLSQNFLRGSEVPGLPWLARAAMTCLLTSVFTRPDFIAYNCKDRARPSLRLMKRLYGVHEVAWTIRDRQTLETLEREGVTPIFEGFVP